MRPTRLVALLVLLTLGLSFSASAEAKTFQVQPTEAKLHGKFARLQLLVFATDGAGQVTNHSADLTSKAVITSSAPNIVKVAAGGRLLALSDGAATITVQMGEETQTVAITAVGVETGVVDYKTDVAPILTKANCATAACHASQFGKGGFKLSVVGFDAQADFEAIARAGRQRRVSFARPEGSLILLKPSMSVPHGGGRRLDPESVEYHIFKTWIETGAPAPRKEAAKVVKVTVSPARRVGQVGMRQQLRVVAHYSDDSTRDVTPVAKFDSMNDGVLSVAPDGVATIVGKGQTAVMVIYEGQAGISTFIVPYSESIELADWKDNNFVDELGANKFRELGLEPSPLCDDATFVRRAFFDAIGTLPTAEESLAFVDSNDPQKREKLVEQLLGLTGDPNQDSYNDQYAAYWALRWSDLVRNSSKVLGEQGMWSLHNWIKEAFRTNKPFDQFVSELVTAKGSIYSNGPANYFRIHGSPTALTEATAQLFLGIRLECAKCHHHPFEKYSQADYYGFAAFFSRVGSKNSEEFGLFGRETVVVVRSSGGINHPRTRKLMAPTPLGGEPMDDALDRRLPLAKWLTAGENEFFARSVVNRYMGFLMGRGLVDPVDDMRSTNPPSNVALLDALAQDFITHDFNLKHLMRTIMTSRLYQLSSQPTPKNISDSRFYSHYRVKRLTAEPLLDAIDQATGVQTKFKSLPLGTHAIELPDAEYPNYFLTTFAKPRRVSVCECERSQEENLSQALHTLNGDILAKKIAAKKGRIAGLLAAKKPHEEVVAELYLSTLSRRPSADEMQASKEFLAESPSPKECYEDLLWALVNSKQFLFVH